SSSLLFLSLDNVESDIGLHHIADLAGSLLKSNFLICSRPSPSSRAPTHFAAIFSAIILRVLLSQLCEIATGFHLLKHIGCLGPGLIDRLLVGLLTLFHSGLNLDLPSPHPLRCAELFLMSVVVLLHVGIGNCNFAVGDSAFQKEVSDLTLFWDEVCVSLLLLLVESLEFGLRGLDLLLNLFQA